MEGIVALGVLMVGSCRISSKQIMLEDCHSPNWDKWVDLTILVN